jgi:hypothetical protein
MSLFVKLEEPADIKKALLITKMAALNNMKRFEECRQYKKETTLKAAEMNEVVIKIPEQIEHIKHSLPEVDIEKISFEKGMLKCEICGKRFKTEHGLKVHQANAHGIRSEHAEHKSLTEVDKIAKELDELEKELRKL